MKLLIVAIVLVLSGCATGGAFSPTPQYDRARVAANNGKPEDVEFCKYEASKIPSTSTNYNYIMQAVENQEQQMRVFNACMQYRSTQNAPTYQAPTPVRQEPVAPLDNPKKLDREAWNARNCTWRGNGYACAKGYEWPGI